MGKKVLITGGAGFIGCTVARLLIRNGHEVTVADNLHPQVHPVARRPTELDEAANFVPHDVSDPGSWRALLATESPAVILHLAAETGTGQSLREASRHALVNVVGTTRLTDALFALDFVPDHIVLTSSRAVYGEGRWLDDDGNNFYPAPRSHKQLESAQWNPLDANQREGKPRGHEASTTEPRPTNNYATTKLAQEQILQAWRAAVNSKLTVLRLQNVYGVGQSVANSYTGVLTFFANQALQKRAINVYEDGEIIRDFVNVQDVARAIAASLEHPPTTDRTVDLGSGRAMTLIEAATALAGAAGAPPPFVSGSFRDGDVRSAWADIRPAQLQIGYDPQISFDEGADQLLRWVAKETQ